MLEVYLKKGREKPIVAGHPWVFSGAISRTDGAVEPGTDCRVRSYDTTVLGYGYFNAHSTLRIRMLTAGDTLFTEALLEQRLKQAIGRRDSIDAEALRLVNSEGDFLPGLIVDRFGPGLCIQVLTAGMAKRRAVVVSILTRLLQPSFIYERSDSESVRREGLEPVSGLVKGTAPEPLIITEQGIRFALDLSKGQKTGFFLDQRENRALVKQYAANRAVLDCFCYSGGFALNAVAGGACSVVAIDASKRALALAEKNRRLNGFNSDALRLERADVLSYLRRTAKRHSMIVLDPPKFARHSGEVRRAARGYKDINLWALKNLEPGGLLFTFSCSQAIDSVLFRQIVFGAAVDAGRQVQVLHVLGQPADHPVNLAHREGEYLTGLAVRTVAV